MAILGIRDSRDIVVNTGVDAAELRRLSLQDGTTLEAVTAELSGALTALNASLSADPLIASLASITDSPEVEYRMGAASQMRPYTEYSKGDADRAELEGHMLPLQAFDKVLGWTWKYMERARMPQIKADVQSAVDAVRTQVRTAVLGRMLRRSDDTGVTKGLGTSGISPGFATAAANTGVDFTPPQYNGTTFNSNHDHYLFAATLTSANIVTLMKTLREHGLTAPFDLIVSETDFDTIKGFSDFTKAADPVVQYGVSNNLASTPFNNGYGGYLADSFARIRVVSGWPATYAALYKSYGPMNPSNPLRIRVKSGSNLVARAFSDPAAGAPSPLSPLAHLAVFLEMGVGVGDRLGAAVWRNNAAWADGTAS